MAGQSIMAGEAVSASTWVWLDTAVDLGVALQVMLSDKALAAMGALKLTISQMGLHVGLDILLATETLITLWEEAHPLLVDRVRAGNVMCNIIDGDAGVLNGVLKIQAVHG
jgi:hypothetical protein